MSKNKNPLSVKPWYQEGLRFKCTECGKCCTGTPGIVWVSEKELLAMAEQVDLAPEDFALKYLRVVNGRMALLEKSDKSYDCIFLDGKRCTIYETRPKQCSTFPWWPQNLESKESWEDLKEECEGVNHKDADLIPFDVIEQVLAEQNIYNESNF